MGQTNLTKQEDGLRLRVLSAIDNYFRQIDRAEQLNLNAIVLEEVEAAMYEGVMRFTRGNQSRAAKLLGVSRGTLRTKLLQYFGTTHVGGIYRV